MSHYALGKRALGICDRCGQAFKLRELVDEWTGFRVCRTCHEPKHPQLEPGPAPIDAQALYKPRPERQEPLIVYVGQSHVFPPPTNPTITGGVGMVGTVKAVLVAHEQVALTGVSATGGVGSPSAVATTGAVVTGVAASTAVGEVVATGVSGPVPVTGLVADAEVGTVVAEGGVGVVPTGVEATGSLGTPTFITEAFVAVTGVAAEGTLGMVIVSEEDHTQTQVTGVEATGSLGTANVTAEGNTTATGVGASSAVGDATVVADATTTTTGVGASSAVGTVTGAAGVGATTTGVGASSAVGTVTATGTSSEVPIVWEEATEDADVVGNNVYNIAHEYPAAAYSQQVINEGEYFEFSVTGTTNNHPGFAQIGVYNQRDEYWFFDWFQFQYIAGLVNVYVDNTWANEVPIPAPGSRYRFAVENGELNFYINGVLVATNENPPLPDLYLILWMLELGDGIEDAVKGTL